LPDITMALHAAAPWVALGAFACGAGSAISSAFTSTTMQQQIPPERLARVSSLTLFPAYGIGVVGYAVDGPLAAALGPAVVFAAGAVYGLLSSAVVLALPSVRAVRWRDMDAPDQDRRVTAACGPRRAGQRTRPAARRP
jgi:MFS family permease